MEIARINNVNSSIQPRKIKPIEWYKNYQYNLGNAKKTDEYGVEHSDNYYYSDKKIFTDEELSEIQETGKLPDGYQLLLIMEHESVCPDPNDPSLQSPIPAIVPAHYCIWKEDTKNRLGFPVKRPGYSIALDKLPDNLAILNTDNHTYLVNKGETKESLLEKIRPFFVVPDSFIDHLKYN